MTVLGKATNIDVRLPRQIVITGGFYDSMLQICHAIVLSRGDNWLQSTLSVFTCALPKV